MNEKDKDKQINCKHCNNLFIPKRRGGMFCHRSCKDKQRQEEKKELTKVKREKKLKEKLTKQDKLLSQSAFGYYLIGEVKRAGTLEILSNQTSESLLELLQLTRSRTRYSGITSGKVNKLYELSHIVAVKDKTRLGLIHPSNLVISPACYNKERGSKVASLNAGLSMERVNLLARHKINDTEKNDGILKRIRQYFGKDVLDGFYRHSNLTRTQRNELLKKIKNFPNAPDFYTLSKMDNEDLSLLLLQLGVSSSRTFSTPSFSELEVALKEMIRNNKQDSVLFWVVEELQNSMEFGSMSNLELLADFRGFQDFVLLQVWNQLHHEPYSLGYDDKHIIECFVLDEGVEPITRLEIALASRRAKVEV